MKTSRLPYRSIVSSHRPAAAFAALGACAVAMALAGPASGQGAVRAIPSASSAMPDVPLADHRATYRVVLMKAVGSKSPTSARGRVSYEFNGSACEGYSQIFRQVTEMQPAEGSTRVSDMRSATYEDGAGKSFSFDVKTTVDGSAPEVVDGHAERKGNDLLAIRLSRPNAQTIDVDNQVLFPTAHLRRIIAAAKAGQHILGVKVFDGSDDGKKVYDTTTIIGHPLKGPAGDLGAAHVTAMDALTRWPVSIAYFDEDHKDAAPVYTLGFELYENGVSRALRFDYGDFTLAGELATLEMLPSSTCRK